ncbi:MAG TPA: hypothetical protein VE984_03105 [Gaiellaceae bacterium]|nr:hypothetical protein [Gaiellaceae bacterium]
MKRIVSAAALAVALAAAGVSAAAAITNPSSMRLLAASHSSSSRGTKITLHKTAVGKVLATSSGRTIYLFMADRKGKSVCYGQCATFWPPVLQKGKLRAGAGVKAGLLGTTRRKNGTRQVTYKGHPLYLFKLDRRAGQIKGQNQDFFGGEWFVVSASGRANKKTPSPSTTTGTTTTTPYSTTSHY